MIVPATPESIQSAADVLRSCGVVAIPTETVYGLACSIDCPQAIARVFELKGRPSDNPLIVHVASIDQAVALTSAEDHDAVRMLGSAFWPGPLTIVVRCADGVPEAVTGGLDTVALRMPAHPVALEIIRSTGSPLAAPSANISGRPSPTRATHVEDDLRGAVTVLDAGPCMYGLESTVVRVLADRILILRQGALSISELQMALPGMTISAADVSDHVHRSPGTRYRHYAPDVPVVLCQSIDEVSGIVAGPEGRRSVVLCSPDSMSALAAYSPREISAATVFDEFRRAEALQVACIVVLCDARLRSDAALMNRLQKAAETDKT